MGKHCETCDNCSHGEKTLFDYGYCSVKHENVLADDEACGKYATGHAFYCESCGLWHGNKAVKKEKRKK